MCQLLNEFITIDDRSHDHLYPKGTWHKEKKTVSVFRKSKRRQREGPVLKHKID